MWIYDNKKILTLDDIGNDYVGFIYELTYLPTNQKYIGRKSLWNKRRQKIGKGEKEKTKTRKKYKEVIKESNWKNYFSSNEFLKENSNESNTERKILKFCKNLTEMSYFEAKFLFCSEALERDDYLNSNIDGRYFKGNLK